MELLSAAPLLLLLYSPFLTSLMSGSVVSDLGFVSYFSLGSL